MLLFFGPPRVDTDQNICKGLICSQSQALSKFALVFFPRCFGNLTAQRVIQLSQFSLGFMKSTLYFPLLLDAWADMFPIF
jgi:hypothetical protein